MIDSFKELVIGCHRQQGAQNDRETQFENEEEAGQPDVLETVDAAINENARCLSSKCSRLPIESARLYEQYLHLACEQLIRSITNIFVQQNQINWKYCLKEELGINEDSVEPRCIENSCWKYTFVFQCPENGQNYIVRLQNFLNIYSGNWYRSAYTCNISHSSSKVGLFSVIHEEDAFDLFNKSNDNEDQITATVIRGAHENYNDDGEEEKEKWKTGTAFENSKTIFEECRISLDVRAFNTSLAIWAFQILIENLDTFEILKLAAVYVIVIDAKHLRSPIIFFFSYAFKLDSPQLSIWQYTDWLFTRWTFPRIEPIGTRPNTLLGLTSRFS